MAHESMTLKDLDDSGRDVRAWCFACGRGALFPAVIWRDFAARGRAIDLRALARKFPCSACRSSADVMLIPATRPPAPADSMTQLVAKFFFMARSAPKGDPIAERAAARLVERIHARRRG